MNNKLPLLLLTLSCFYTTSILAQSKPAITMVTTLEMGSRLLIELQTNRDHTVVLIDPGNGVLIERDLNYANDRYPIGIITRGDTVRIYSKPNTISSLICVYMELSSLDVSNCTELKSLYCHNNKLTSLDVSNNKKLEEIGYANNELASLDLSQNLLLKEVHTENSRGNNVSPKLPTMYKSMQAREKEEKKRSLQQRFNAAEIGFALNLGYLGMPSSKINAHSHYQSLWYVGGDVSISPTDKYPYGGNTVHQVFLGGGVLLGHFEEQLRAVPVISVGYFNGSVAGLDFKVDVSPYHINPYIGLNAFNMIKLNAGYSFSTKNFYNTELQGFTFGITISLGTSDYYIDLSN